ncbi:tyrosine-type recombinase/integrase [Albibacillus kandeliae]|uniref:tyrosine-type recombinase/integrase n=1 Tax=Albibacillus kandeliae TaxID=2174228 RepID=UPI0038BA975C
MGRLRGGFCVSWYDGGKRRRHKLASRTRKEAEAEALDVYRHETIIPDEGCTVERIWAEYIASLGDKPAAATLRYTGKAILPHFGKLRPDQIEIHHCRSYAELRERQGKSQGTVHTELGHLRSAMKYGERTKMTDRAPHIWRPEKPAPKERFLTREEIWRLLTSCGSPHIELAVTLLLGTAGRVGAILDLEWHRVDFERSQINLRLDDSKTRKGRAVVPMNGMTRAALQTARDAALSDYVVEYGGERVKSIRTGFYSACERAKLEDVTIHTLRHTSAVHMAEAGVPISKISQYLGHSNTQTTERVYARYAPSHMQDAADVLNFTEARIRLG